MTEVSRICYRDLNRYRHELRIPAEFETGITGYDINTNYIKMTPDGVLFVEGAKTHYGAGYAWDGPSIPGLGLLPKWLRERILDKSLRASLPHDALYQLLREGHLPLGVRIKADALLRRLCVEDGMDRFEAKVVYEAVRRYGLKHALPRPMNPDKVAPNTRRRK